MAILWTSVPLVLWTSVLLILCAVNLHFFWTAQHSTAPSAIRTPNNTSLQSGFLMDDGRISSKPEVSTVDFNDSVPPSTSDGRFLSTMSQQFAASLSSIFQVPENVDHVLEMSKFSVVTANPVELGGPSTNPVSASAWPTAEDDVQYCLIDRRYIRFYFDIWYWIDLTLWSIAPFITIIHAFSTLLFPV